MLIYIIYYAYANIHFLAAGGGVPVRGTVGLEWEGEWSPSFYKHLIYESIYVRSWSN